ncbi:MAG: erythromycin esterase family protein [Bacteroidota bacterium]
MRTLPAEVFRHTRVRLEGWLLTEDVGADGARLWIRVNGEDGRVLALDNLEGRAASGTDPWVRYVVEVDVPPDAGTIAYGALLIGPGRLVVDDLALIQTDTLALGQPHWTRTPWLADPGFERTPVGGWPSSWGGGGGGHEVVVDTVAWSGRRSLRMRKSPTSAASDGPVVGVATQWVDGSMVRGRRVRLSGYIRTEGVEEEFAGLWVRVDGPTGMVSLDNMGDRGPRGTTPWRRYVVEADVPIDARGVAFGALKPGDGTAWFDDLVLETASGPDPESASGGSSLGNLGGGLIDLSRPATNPADVEWLAARAVPLDTARVGDSFADLQVLESVLGPRRIVGLGESSHGVAEFNRSKARLVRYLHEHLGYDVLAFEAPLFDCHRANAALDASAAEVALRDCAYSVWETEEVLELFKYVAETRSTDRPLRLVGFDNQHARRDTTRTAFLVREFDAVGLGAEAARLEAILADAPPPSLSVTPGAFIEYVEGPGADLVRGYESLADQAEAVAGSEGLPLGGTSLGLAVQVARSLHAHVEQTVVGDRGRAALRRGDSAEAGTLRKESMAVRDLQMAENLAYLVDEAYPEAKVIAWAHNLHLSHGPSNDGWQWMGEHVKDRYAEAYYAVGFYAGGGEMAANDRTVHAVMTPGDYSLEATIIEAGLSDVFVDLSEGDWAGRLTTAMDWGQTPVRIVPRSEYGGILCVEEVSAPAYLSPAAPGGAD